MKDMTDTILCKDKKDAHKVIDAIGSEHIDTWDFLDSGAIKIYLNCRLRILRREIKHDEHTFNHPTNSGRTCGGNYVGLELD